MILKEYVYQALSLYGNTIISAKEYKKFTEKQILDNLRQHGFNCTIEKRELANNDFNCASRTRREVVYLIEEERVC